MDRRLFVGTLAATVASLAGSSDAIRETMADDSDYDPRWESTTVTVGKTGATGRAGSEPGYPS